MRHHGGRDTERDELVERGVLGRLPRLAPDLVPPRQHARVPMTAFAVVHGDAARDDRAGLLETFARLAQRGGVKTELGLEVLDRARSRGLQMPHQPRAIVGRRIGLLERGTAQRIRGARRFGREEQRLAAMQFRLEDVVAERELAAPAPLRLRPRREALLRVIESFLVRGGEEARDAAVLGQREQLAIGEEREGVVQCPQLPIRSEPAVVKPPGAKLR